MRTVFNIKLDEDLKTKYKPGSDCYLGQTLSQIEAKKRKLFKNPLARFRFIAKISLLSLCKAKQSEFLVK